MKQTITIIAVLVMASCSVKKAANRVVKDPEQFERVGKMWVRKNPLKVDTVTRVIPGDTVWNTVRDTIFRATPVPCDDFADTTVGGVRIVVKEGKLYIDYKKPVVKPTVVVREFENLERVMLLQDDVDKLTSENNGYRKAITDMTDAHKKQIEEQKKETKKWRLNFWLMLGFSAAVGALIVYVRTRGKIPFIGKR